VIEASTPLQSPACRGEKINTKHFVIDSKTMNKNLAYFAIGPAALFFVFC
jgi:hypothetical protein